MAGFTKLTYEQVVDEFPAWLTWGVRKGAKLAPLRTQNGTIAKGANGLPFCMWCRGEVKKPRKNWCSPECVGKYMAVGSWGALADYIFRRDGGRCRHCESDHPGWRQRDISTEPQYRMPLFLARHGWQGPANFLLLMPWQVDHILPVSLGGNDNPENLRLLCYWCHQIETNKLRKILAKSARISAAN